MSTLKALRDAHARLIAQNPVDVTVVRAEYEQAETGGRRRRVQAPPGFRGRLLSRGDEYRVDVGEAGAQQTAVWLLLAPWDVDLREGDQVNVGGQAFRVTRVRRFALEGEPFAVHAYLEEVRDA